MAGGLKSVVCVATAWLAGAAWAQLADPTRPPSEVIQPSPAAGVGPVATGLQSIIRRREGRPTALINGEVVELGGRVGEAQLVEIGEDAVVLLGPQGRETLRLMPAAEKQTKSGAGKTAKPVVPNAHKGEKAK